MANYGLNDMLLGYWPWICLALGSIGILAYNALRWAEEQAKFKHLAAHTPATVTFKSFPKVSILVAAWNEAALIEQHIQSVLSLHYPNKEYLVCAGGNDDTYALASRFQGPNVVLVKQEPGEGKQSALRKCLARVSGEIIFLTDGDCLLSNQAFELILEPIINGEEDVVTGTFEPLLAQRHRSLVQYRWALDRFIQAHFPMHIQELSGRNCALRRRALEKVGGFSYEARIGTDYALAKRLILNGYRIRHMLYASVGSEYPDTISTYVRHHTRVLRNLLVHNSHMALKVHLLGAILSAMVSVSLLGLPLLGLIISNPIVLSLGLWLIVAVIVANYRRLLAGNLLTGVKLSSYAIASEALYALLDHGVTVIAFVELFVQPVRW